MYKNAKGPETFVPGFLARYYNKKELHSPYGCQMILAIYAFRFLPSLMYVVT